jgi:hypothetical protein
MTENAPFVMAGTNRAVKPTVIPAKAGIQMVARMDSGSPLRFGRNDGGRNSGQVLRR